MMNALEVTSYRQPIRKSAQRLRWFFRSFEEHVTRIETETRMSYAVDKKVLAAVFARWLKLFNAQKPKTDADKPAYVGFAAGLMLHTLIDKQPARVLTRPAEIDRSEPAHYWPEGYLYVTYCLYVRSLVIEIDYQGEQGPDDVLADIRAWWSFKENTQEDPSLAIGFLDLFAGEEADWTRPSFFRPDRGRVVLSRNVPLEIRGPAS